MLRRFFVCLLALSAMFFARAEPSYKDIELPPHFYSQRTPADQFTRLKADLESGKIALDQSSEKNFVASLLKLFDVPASSQMLVFSTTSLQLSLISPSNPRALYFNDDLYIGWVPNGRIEILSIDPNLGAIFYIFEIPKNGGAIHPDRSDRCAKCHAAADTGFVPGLVIKSVIPGTRGGSLDAFRIEQTGHQVPFEQRFGGWYVTGKNPIAQKANRLGQFSPQGIVTTEIAPGKLFSFEKYLAPTSDVLPQLLLEHQAGFINRTVAATYHTRAALEASRGLLTAKQSADLEAEARALVRYLLFADEAPLPDGGIVGDAAFESDFLARRRVAPGGVSLRDFDLRTRLFKYRCSYMIYSTAFSGLPPEMKQRVYRRLGEALNIARPDAEFAYLSRAEKQTIRLILRATLTGLPRDF